DPIRLLERVVPFTIRTKNARVHVVDAIAKVIVQGVIEMVVPFERARVEDGEIIRRLPALEARHERSPFWIVAQPRGWEMNPVVDDVLQPRLVQQITGLIVLTPIPLAPLALDGAPGDVIFVRD